MRLAAWGLAAAWAALPPAATAQQHSYRTMVESRKVDRSDVVQVNVDFALGRFRLAPAGNGQLYRVGLTYLEDQFEPDVSYDAGSGSLEVSLSGERDRSVSFKDLDDIRQRLDLQLSPDVPMHVDLEFGAVEADIELGGLTLQTASLETGASQTTVRFSTPNRAACEDLSVEVGAAEFRMIGLGNSRCRQVDVSGGVAEITLDFSGEWTSGSEMHLSTEFGLGDVHFRVPENVGVQINVDRFLVSLNLDGFAKQGSSYYSQGWDRAAARIIVELNGALGSVEVEWIR
jgi:hypothetical protein